MDFEFTDYAPYDFANRRHIGPSPDEMAAMLEVVGAASLDRLIDETVPSAIRQEEPLDWGAAMTEREVLDRLRETADLNRNLVSLLGQGYHGTITPPVIQRTILENPAWYTAYTPYQPEISQGRLEALLNYQTMVSDLTGLDIANASLLDEATAAAEAMAMARRIAKSKAAAFFVDRDCHPQTIAVLRTRAEPLGWELIVGDPFRDLDPSGVFGAIFQYPGTYGHVRDFTETISALHAEGALAIMAADPLALCLLKSPGEMGADIAVGSTQRFGVPMGYGGPHAAYMAVCDACKRAMPGRLVGVSVDQRGNRAYRLALQTREQHIRREKATSNICTAQVLLAVMASMYAVFHGPKGLRAIAQQVHGKTARLADGLESLGYEVEPDRYFDTITVEVGRLQGVILGAALAAGINLRRIGDTRIGITLDERTRPSVVEAVWKAFGGALSYGDIEPRYALSQADLRKTAYLDHPVFHMNRAESEMTRYIRRLSDRDLALDRAMIPLGSCTMKLNATVEMLPISWPEFSELHPFVPADQAEGYRRLIDDLSEKLCRITGYDAISMQPNSGAQGEYAGLLTIRAWHRSRGDAGRDVCLIPTSAHGTNPASAHMAGMTVVAVKSLENGDIDIDDFRAKADSYARPARSLHDHLSLDARRLRGDRAGDLRHHPPAWRTGVSRRCKPQRPRRHRAARRRRSRCQPPEPAQDILHSPWRRRPRHGPDRRQGAPRPASAGPRRHGRPRGRRVGRPVRLGVDPADLLELLPPDGRRRADPGDPCRDPQRELHRRAAEGGLRRAVHLAKRSRGARMHHRHPPAGRKCRHHRRRYREAARRLRLPRADDELAGRRYPDDRADGSPSRRPRSTASATPCWRSARRFGTSSPAEATRRTMR